MREWRKVTKPEEVADGQRVRYWKEGDCYVFGNHDHERFFGSSDKAAKDKNGVIYCESVFVRMCVEALFDDGIPVCRETPMKSETPAHVHTPVDDGGPAFPFLRETGNEAMSLCLGGSGMTLRDWFAGKALEGDWATQDEHSGYWSNDTTPEAFETRAKMYYNMADAMLKARAAK